MKFLFVKFLYHAMLPLLHLLDFLCLLLLCLSCLWSLLAVRLRIRFRRRGFVQAAEQPVNWLLCLLLLRIIHQGQKLPHLLAKPHRYLFWSIPILRLKCWFFAPCFFEQNIAQNWSILWIRKLRVKAHFLFRQFFVQKLPVGELDRQVFSKSSDQLWVQEPAPDTPALGTVTLSNLHQEAGLWPVSFSTCCPSIIQHWVQALASDRSSPRLEFKN